MLAQNGCIELFQKVLDDTNILPEILKSKSVDQSKVVELTDALKETVMHYCSKVFFEECFFEQFRLYKIAVILPVISATCEQSFSAMKIIKIQLRSPKAESRLPNLSVLSIVKTHQGLECR